MESIIKVSNKSYNEVFVSKIISETPKLSMGHNATCVFFLVLQKLWYRLRTELPEDRKEEFYNYNGSFKDLEEIMELEDLDLIIELSKKELNDFFYKQASFESMITLLKSIPKHISVKSNYDLLGNYSKTPNDIEISLFNEIAYVRDEKVIQFKFNKNALYCIDGFERFTKIDLNELKHMNTQYKMRGYEYITHFNYLTKNGKHDARVEDSQRIITVGKFRSFMGIPECYTLYDVERKVFKPMIKAINEHTKFNIESIEKFTKDRRNPKKVTHYRINIGYKKEYLNKIAADVDYEEEDAE